MQINAQYAHTAYKNRYNVFDHVVWRYMRQLKWSGHRFSFDYIGVVAGVSDIKTLGQIIVTHKSHSHIYPTVHKTEIWLVIYLPHPLIFPPLSLWSLHVSKHVEKKPKGQYREFLTLRQLSETPDLEKKCQISYKKKSFWHHGI